MNELEHAPMEWITMSPQYGLGEAYGRGFWSGSGMSMMNHYAGENDTGGGCGSYDYGYGSDSGSGKGVETR